MTKTSLTKRSNPFHYKECGLDNVWLLGLREDEDGDIVIPAPVKLHNMLAKLLATQKEKLSGKGIRFLRTHMGLSGRDLAERYLEVAPETVSRWENSINPSISTSSERLLRMMILKGLKVHDYEVSSLASTRSKMNKLRLEPNGASWEKAA